jgi:hypothetical protein
MTQEVMFIQEGNLKKYNFKEFMLIGIVTVFTDKINLDNRYKNNYVKSGALKG